MIPRSIVSVSVVLLAWTILTSAQQGGVPAQSMPQTAPPAASESFQPARTYFDQAAQLGIPAYGSPEPYVLRAEFDAKGAAGVATGNYKDTWMSKTQWRREAAFGTSRYIRTRNGDQRYELAVGPDAPALRFVMRALEPIPAADHFVESDWKIKRDVIGGVRAIRLLSGSEDPDGMLDAKQNLAYWFGDSGALLRTYLTGGFETDYRDFEAFGKLRVARQIFVRQHEAVAIRIHVIELKSSPRVSADRFRLPGYRVDRVFRAEER